MSDQLKKGDKVEWNSAGKKVEGTVEKKLTEPTDIKSHHVAASKDNPEYLVKRRQDWQRSGTQARRAQKAG